MEASDSEHPPPFVETNRDINPEELKNLSRDVRLVLFASRTLQPELKPSVRLKLAKRLAVEFIEYGNR